MLLLFRCKYVSYYIVATTVGSTQFSGGNVLLLCSIGVLKLLYCHPCVLSLFHSCCVLKLRVHFRCVSARVRVRACVGARGYGRVRWHLCAFVCMHVRVGVHACSNMTRLQHHTLTHKAEARARVLQLCQWIRPSQHQYPLSSIEIHAVNFHLNNHKIQDLFSSSGFCILGVWVGNILNIEHQRYQDYVFYDIKDNISFTWKTVALKGLIEVQTKDGLFII